MSFIKRQTVKYAYSAVVLALSVVVRFWKIIDLFFHRYL